MYPTTDRYKEIVYERQFVLKVFIDNIEIPSQHILAFKSSYQLFSDEFSLGSTPARTIDVKIYKDSLPSTYQNIYIEAVLPLRSTILTVKQINSMKVKDVSSSFVHSFGHQYETIPIGYFSLEDICKDNDYTVDIKAIDYMSKFEFNYDGSTLFNNGTAKLITILQDICTKAGVELGSTSFLNDNKEVSVYDNTVSARTYISYIAEQAGGFAFIGRDGKLYIKTIGEDTTTVNKQLFKDFSLGDKFTVSRIAYEDGIRSFKYGNITKNTIWINPDNMYIVDTEQISDVYNAMNNFECYSFEGTTIIDPSIDIGDIIVVDNKRIVYQGDFEYKKKFTAQISSKIQPKTKEDTTTVKTASQKTINRRVQSSINQVEGTITQLAEEQTEQGATIAEHTVAIGEITSSVTNIEENIEDNIPTKVEMNSAINQKAGEITSSVSETYSTKTETATAKTQAINSADASTDTKLASYSTTSQMNSAINQKAGEITSSVSETYSTKTETATAKTQAINSANASTDTKLQNYDTSTQVTSKITQKAGELTTEINKKVNDSELSTKITQNYEAVKIAWNTITQYIQFANAQLQIKDNSNKLLMALSQLGQYFYRSNGTTLIGTVGRIDNQNQIAFGINGDVSGNSMVWGIYKTINGTKTFFPVFNYGGYNVDTSASEFGGLFYLEAPLILQEQFLYLGQDNYSSYIQGLDSGERKSITLGSVDDLYITDTSNNDIFVINNEYLKFSDILEVGISYLGNYSFDFKGNAITNTSNIVNSFNVKYLDGTFSGNGSLYVGERDGTGAFTLYASSSDKRLKKNIKKSKTNALDLINQISHKEFNWKSDNKHIEIGYIAQEMEELNPNFVHKAEIKNKEGATIDYEYQINLLNVLATATKAIQEQQEQIKILKEKDNQKDEIIANLIKRIEKLEAKK